MTAARENMGNGGYGWESPANNAAAVSPSDTVDLEYIARSLFVGTGGDVTVITAGGQTVTFTNVPDGCLLPVRASRVKSTGTDATDIVALW